MTESLLRGAGRERVEKAAMGHSTLPANAQLIRQSTSRSIGAKRRRVVLAATIGNTLEWYDFLVYGLLAVTIAKLFFPTGSELSSLLLSMGTFGVGLVMRPVGAIVLGIYADRVGRRAALSWAIVIMALHAVCRRRHAASRVDHDG